MGDDLYVESTKWNSIRGYAISDIDPNAGCNLYQRCGIVRGEVIVMFQKGHAPDQIRETIISILKRKTPV